jgi:hypothetical protein
MSDLPKCLLIVTAEIDPEVEDNWNKWYDEVHLPDATACPGVHGGQRYVTMQDGVTTDHGAKTVATTKVYTTIYEIDGPEVMETKEFQAMRGWYHFTDRIRATTRVVKAL